MFQNVWFWTYTLFIFYYYLHMKMKKMLIGAFLGMFALAGVAILPNQVSAQPATQEGWFNAWWWDAQNDSAGEYNPTVAGSTTLQGDSLIRTIRTAINWVLGMLSVIALALCLYAGFLMVTSAGDEKKYKDGLGILKYAAIWLAIIWLSWLIVSVIFRIINSSVTLNDGTTTNW